jgi:hypothetical protein
MPTMDVLVRRFSVVSLRPFEEVVRRLTATIGRPNISAFHDAVASAATVNELHTVVRGAIGSSDLMEFARYDSGDVLRRSEAAKGRKCSAWSLVIL